MSEATTDGVRIEVESVYVPERSLPDESYYFFAYQVKIKNVGDVPAQLISREWIITDSDGNVETVRGPGVVGDQPRLEPGQEYEYMSFCPLRTAVGSMQGSYQMVRDDGQQFDAQIAPFTLAVPHVVN